MKYLSSILFWFIILCLSSKSLLGQEKPTAAPSIETFATSADQLGATANSVNLFTGDVALSLNLISIFGHNDLDVSVSISYNSNVQNQVNISSHDSPTTTLGLGWSMGIPKIFADHKETGAKEDDEYYLLEGDAASPLIYTGKTGSLYTYSTKSYQFWKITYDAVAERWEVIKENGIKHVYGDNASNRSTVQWAVAWDNWIGNSAQITGQTQMANAWNLSEIKNNWGEQITFEYENVENFVGSSAGKKHTEASYIKKITDVIGRQVIFYYGQKSANQYQEPHTENIEPDGYQEYYENRFLDHMDLNSEFGKKIFSLHFTYSAIDTDPSANANTSKILLSSIVQKNADGDALPSMRFTYSMTGATAGFLNQVTTPTGAITKYTYTSKTLNHSNRRLVNIIAPSGYGEPDFWASDDYVVVAWRALGTGGIHESTPKNVKLYVYQWVGEWKEKFIQDISGVSFDNTNSNINYTDFEVEVQKDFFAVLSRGSGNTYLLSIQYKDLLTRSEWIGYSDAPLDLGVNVREDAKKLTSGDNFIAVGSSTTSLNTYTYQGNSWRKQIITQPVGKYFYTATNNYIISHNMDANPDNIYFNFLTEDKQWTTRTLPSANLFNSTVNTTHWYSTNSFAFVLPSDNNEFFYRWDKTYSIFYKDDVVGALPDAGQTFLLNNNMMAYIGSNYGKAARFNGLNWQVTPNFTIYNPNTSITFGEDYSLWAVNEAVSPVSLYLKQYNANLLNWNADQTFQFNQNFSLFGTTNGINPNEAGLGFFIGGENVYRKQTNATWPFVRSLATTTPAGSFINSNSLKFSGKNYLVYGYANVAGGSDVGTRVQMLRNGNFLGSPISIPGLTSYYRNTNGPNTVITLTFVANPTNISAIHLYRVANESIDTYQTDYPVTQIEINDGYASKFTSYDYDLNSAASDHSGDNALYNKITTIPGVSNYVAGSSFKPFGYTETYFYNGLSPVELSLAPPNTEYITLKGVVYETRLFDSGGNQKSQTINSYTVTSKDILNTGGIKVNVANFSRLTQKKLVEDGITQISIYSFNLNTGLLSQASVNNYDANGNLDNILTEYKYWWEIYDISRTKNLLTPVIQITKKNNSVITSLTSTTWKGWGSFLGLVRE